MRVERWMWVVLLLVLALGAGAWSLNRSGGEGVSYRTVVLARGPMQAAVSSAGTVNPVRQVQVGTQVSGQIVELLADFNTVVKKGQLIARIDPENFENKVRQSQADVDAARAAVLTAQATVNAALAAVSKARLDAANADRDVARKKDLLEKEFISAAEYDTTRNTAGTFGELLKATLAQVDVARAQVQNAEATVKQREASLAQSRVDIERTQIRSPVDGVVIKRSVDVGQTVAASLQAPELFIIARDLNDMQVEVAIDEADIGRLKVGQAATFTVDAYPGRTYEGRVTQVRKAAISLQNVVTYTAVVSFANLNAQLLPGMTANARIVTDEREAALKVPNAALRLRLPDVPDVPDASEPADAASAPTAKGASAPMPAGHPPAGTTAPASAFSVTSVRTSGRIYVLGADGKPVAQAVRLGVSDGVSTEVLPGPSASARLEEGASVVVGVVTPPKSQGAGPRFGF